MISKNLFKFRNQYTNDAINLDELPLVIDQIPQPVVIINSRNKTILSINDMFSRLTNYGSHELVGSEIHSLFRKFPGGKIEEGRAYKDQLISKRNQELSVTFEVYYISQKNSMALIKFTDKEIGIGESNNINKKIINGINHIGGVVFSGDTRIFYQVVLDEFCEIFNCAVSCLYS